jgi:hypothetical protein
MEFGSSVYFYLESVLCFIGVFLCVCTWMCRLKEVGGHVRGHAEIGVRWCWGRCVSGEGRELPIDLLSSALGCLGVL